MNYKITAITWNGLWAKKTLDSSTAISSGGYFKFKIHNETFYGQAGTSLPSGTTLELYSDHYVAYNGSTVIDTQDYLDSVDSSTSMVDLSTINDRDTQLSDQYTTETLHDLDEENTQLKDVKLKLQTNAAGELTFTMPASHSIHSNQNQYLIPMNTLLVVYEGSTILWQGRLTSKTENLDGSIECSAEGLLACMNDDFIQPYDYETDGKLASALFFYYIQWHYISISNDSYYRPDSSKLRVYPFKRWFKDGDSGGLSSITVYRSDTEWSNMNTLVKEAILDTLGGFVYLTYGGTAEEYAPTINYTSDLTEIAGHATRTVRFAENLKDFSIDKDCSEFYTHLMPLGKEAEDVASETEEGETTYSDGRFRLTYDATDRKYVDSQGCIELRKVFKANNALDSIRHMSTAGRIIHVENFDDCTTQNGLYVAAKQFIQKLNFDYTYDVSAVDMHIIDSSQQSTPIHVGDTLEVFSYGNTTTTPDFQAVVTAIDLNISKPWESTYTIGNLNNKQVTKGVV